MSSQIVVDFFGARSNYGYRRREGGGPACLMSAVCSGAFSCIAGNVSTTPFRSGNNGMDGINEYKII